MKKITTVLSLFLLLSIVSCAPAGPTEHEYGFFGGAWHGITITFSGIGYWLGSDVGFTAVTNNGFFYYFGYVIGILLSIPIDFIILISLFGVSYGFIYIFRFFRNFIG